MKIYLIGYMGSGKSTVGKILARELSLPLVDLDHRIVESEGREIAEIFEQEGEKYFRELEKMMLRRVSQELESGIISLGGGTPCGEGAMDFLLDNGVVVYLKLSVEALASRLESAKVQRPLLRGKSPQELREFIAVHLASREPIYQKAHITVDNSTRNITPLLTALRYYQNN